MSRKSDWLKRCYVASAVLTCLGSAAFLVSCVYRNTDGMAFFGSVWICGLVAIIAVVSLEMINGS